MNFPQLAEKDGYYYYYIDRLNILLKTDYWGSCVFKKRSLEVDNLEQQKQAQDEIDCLLKNVDKDRTIEHQKCISDYFQSPPPIEGIRIVPTLDCNLACHYCPQKHLKNKKAMTMNIKTASQAVEFILKNNINKSLYINFYGGEPLLDFPAVEHIIKNIVTHLSDKHELHFSTTTNGTFLNDKIIDFLIHYNFSLGISIDGPAHIHNKNRIMKNGKGSFRTVLRNVQKIREKHKSFFFNKITFMPTIDRESFADFKSVMDFFAENDMPSVNVNWLLGKKENPLISKDIIQKVTSNIINRRYKNMPWFDFMKKIDELRHGGTDLDVRPCGAGTKIIAIAPTGDIYPCEQFIDIATGKIGDVVNGIDKKLVANIFSPLQQHVEGCTRCWAMRFCPYHCIFLQIWSDKKRCVHMRKQTEDILRMCVELAEYDPNSYLDFLAHFQNKAKLFKKDEYL